MRKTAIVLTLLLIGVVSSLPAQDGATDDLFSDESLFGSGDSFSDDSFFGGDSLVEEVDSSAESTAVTDLVASGDVIIGGTISISGSVDLLDDPGAADVALSTRLFLDARPSEDLGVYVKGDLSYDATEEAEFELRELFADTNIDEEIFIRAGKQTINWGAGYFYSPANVINLEEIDPENPEDELLGPVAFRAQIPAGTTNLLGYALLDDTAAGEPVGFGALGEFLVDGYEVSIGGIYQQDNPWAGMVTLTGSAGDIQLFAEGVVEGDLDRKMVVADGSSLTVEAMEGVYFSGTAGASWSYSDDVGLFSVSLTGQYYYNGTGYEDPSVITDNINVVTGLVSAGDLAMSDLQNRGLHYGAAGTSFSNILDSDVTPSVTWIGNMSDGSGMVISSLRYSGIDNLSLNLGWTHSYGAAGSEYAPFGSDDAVSLSLSLAGGSF